MATMMIDKDWWHSVQTNLTEAVDICNDITAAIAAHRRNGKYDAEDLLKLIDGYVRDARSMIEPAVTKL